MLDQLMFGTKEIIAFLAGIVATVAWFVRLEARSLNNKEDIQEINRKLLLTEQRREHDVEQVRQYQRESQSAISELSKRVDIKFDRLQDTSERILVKLGEKADR